MPGAGRITLGAMARLVQIEASFVEAFARRSVYVRHALVDHPLFTMDAIAELADCLPQGSVRRERGHLPFINTDGYVEAFNMDNFLAGKIGTPPKSDPVVVMSGGRRIGSA